MTRIRYRFAMKLAGAAAGLVLAAGMVIAVAPQAVAGPQCTDQQPYPDSPLSICTGYGQTCLRTTCKYPPGTPGKWGVDGHYTPCTNQYGC